MQLASTPASTAAVKSKAVLAKLLQVDPFP